MGQFSEGGYLVLQAVADTHAVIWYIFADSQLSTTARNFIEQVAANGDQIAVASITLAEIIYLIERARIPINTFERLLEAMDQDDALLVEIPFNRSIAEALRQVDRNQVPDLPDRMIAATGLYLGVPVISRDHRIQLSSVNTIW
jgi:PIN domain nuclease of toxin-antitoxin system